MHRAESMMQPILVTGAAGRVGGVGRTVVELLRARGIPVRAHVRRDDDRAAALRALGAEVVMGDLTHTEDVTRILDGVERAYLGLGISAQYLDATITVAAVARSLRRLEVLLNVSQMTVSELTTTRMTDSTQQRQHWLVEQVLGWSGLPIVEIRPTVFLENPMFFEWAAESIAKDASIRLPFGTGRTSPIAAHDVAEVVATILADPARHVGHVYELTGPQSEDMNAVAAEYSNGLGRDVRYIDVPIAWWKDHVLSAHPLPDHLVQHLTTMAALHAQNRYDRHTDDVAAITGKPATHIREWVAAHADRLLHPSPAALSG
jgi:uncharacterized protein YbjT (DUF2867 family)